MILPAAGASERAQEFDPLGAQSRLYVFFNVLRLFLAGTLCPQLRGRPMTTHIRVSRPRHVAVGSRHPRNRSRKRPAPSEPSDYRHHTSPGRSLPKGTARKRACAWGLDEHCRWHLPQPGGLVAVLASVSLRTRILIRRKRLPVIFALPQHGHYPIPRSNDGRGQVSCRLGGERRDEVIRPCT